MLNPFIEYIRSALKIVLDHFSYEAVFHYLRCGLADFLPEEIDTLENYVLACGIKGRKKWSQAFVRLGKDQSPEILEKINRINIEDKQNYTLKMEEEKKTVYLGNASNLSSRMLYLKAVLEDTKGLTGEIFISGDLVKEKAFFRQAQ